MNQTVLCQCFLVFFFLFIEGKKKAGNNSRYNRRKEVGMASISREDALTTLRRWIEDRVLSLEEVVDCVQNMSLPSRQPAITGGQVASVATVVQTEPWTRLLSDAQVLEFYANRTDQRTGKTVAELLPRVRELFTAQDNSYTGPVVVRRRAGYTLKGGAVQEGPCWENFAYLQDWNFPDEAGPEVLIFGAPVVLKSLFNKGYPKEHKKMRRLEKKFGLPAGFLSFGTLQDSSAFMLAQRDQSIRVGGSELYFRTETKLASGVRLTLRWYNGDLRCHGSIFADKASRNVCGLVQGVVVLESSAA